MAALAYRLVTAVDRLLGGDPYEPTTDTGGVDDCTTCAGTALITITPAIGPRVPATVTCPVCDGTGEAGAA